MLDFYLSEMAVSDHHGGGLTLQRTLGEELDGIGRFVHVSAFANKFPPIPRLTNKSIFLTSPFERESITQLIGCTACSLIHENRTVETWTTRWMARKISALYGRGQPLRVFTCPQGLRSIQVLEWLKKAHEVHYVTWMMDDHIVRYRGQRWGYPNGAREMLRQHFQDAQTVFVISPTLGEFYQNEFGVNTVTLFGPADATNSPTYDAPSPGKETRIAYFGRVWGWQVDALIVFANEMRRESNDVLHVYAPEEPILERLRCFPNIKIERPISSDVVIKKMTAYDAVLIPMSFGDELRYLTEFNIATKMSECIASGTVTIVYGPRYSAMVRLLRNTGAAVIISDEAMPPWREIANKIKGPNSRRQILQAAAAFAREQLAPDLMRGRWQSAVKNLVNLSNPLQVT